MKVFLLIITLFAFSSAAYAVVNINTATQAELETLQGIGPAKAKAIVDHRKKNGPFRSSNDLEKVNGVGPGIMKRLRKDITVGGTTTDGTTTGGTAMVQRESKPISREEKKSSTK